MNAARGRERNRDKILKREREKPNIQRERDNKNKMERRSREGFKAEFFSFDGPRRRSLFHAFFAFCDFERQRSLFLITCFIRCSPERALSVHYRAPKGIEKKEKRAGRARADRDRKKQCRPSICRLSEPRRSLLSRPRPEPCSAR